MAWTAPRTFVVAEIVTAAIMNTHLRDQLRYLKGLDGVPTVQNGLIIDNSLGTEYLRIPSLTTAQRDALTPVNGMVIYNSTLTVFQRYEAGAWVSYNNLATMAITSQAQGDILYASSATVWARLAAGTSGKVLQTQGAAANPIWAALLDNNLLAAGNLLIGSWDAELVGTTTDYVLKKSLTLTGRGTLRIKFDLQTMEALFIVYGKIYRNGIAVGTERSDITGVFVTFSEDIAGWANGDTIELWLKGHASTNAAARNFRIYALFASAL